jgi:surface antigen
MHTIRSRRLPALALLVPLALGGGIATFATPGGSAWADPPHHAPAHGWRKKHDREYDGYTGDHWERDYGVRSGRCNTDEVLAAVGAVAGGVIGNRTADEGNRTVATIVGAIIGGVLGAKLGDAIDDRDRACIGHSLELARTGHTVYWTNPTSRVDYAVRPTRNLRGGCREFELVANRGGRKQAERMKACRVRGGEWEFERR